MTQAEFPSSSADNDPQPRRRHVRRAAVALTALSVVGVAGVVGWLNRGGDGDVSAATPTDTGRPSASSVPVPGPETTKYPELPSLKYIEGPEREGTITAAVKDITTRILNDANSKTPRGKVEFDDKADSMSPGEDGHNKPDKTAHDGKGALRETFDLGGGATVVFTVNVKTAKETVKTDGGEEKVTKYVFNDLNHVSLLRTEYSGPTPEVPNATFNQTVDYVRSAAPGDSGAGAALPWTVTINETTQASRGHGSGGSAASGWEAAMGVAQPGFDPQPPVPEDALRQADQYALTAVSDLAVRVGL